MLTPNGISYSVSRGGNVDKDQLVSYIKDIKKNTKLSDEDAAILAASKYETVWPKLLLSIIFDSFASSQDCRLETTLENVVSHWSSQEHDRRSKDTAHQQTQREAERGKKP